MPYSAKVPVKVYEMRLFCDCGGEMRATGMSRPTDPPQYEHKCEDCHATEYVPGKAYPHLVYSDGGRWSNAEAKALLRRA